jgi:hypothetical protein
LRRWVSAGLLDDNTKLVIVWFTNLAEIEILARINFGM